jgi:hypothetical protein
MLSSTRKLLLLFSILLIAQVIIITPAFTQQTKPEEVLMDQLEVQAPELFLLLNKSRLKRNLSIVLNSAAKGEVVKELPTLDEPGKPGPDYDLISRIAKPREENQEATNKVIAHIIGNEGDKIVEKTEDSPMTPKDNWVPNSEIKPNIKFKSKETIAPFLPNCDTNQTIVVEKRSLTPPTKAIDDLLIIGAEPPSMSTEIFGSFTRVMQYKAGTNDPQSIIMSKMGLQCLPFRIRNYQEVSIQDMGLNALANYDVTPEKAEFHQYVKDHLKDLIR